MTYNQTNEVIIRARKDALEQAEKEAAYRASKKSRGDTMASEVPGLSVAISEVGNGIERLASAVATLDQRVGPLLRPESAAPPEDLPCIWASIHCQSLYRQAMALRNLEYRINDIVERLEL